MSIATTPAPTQETVTTLNIVKEISIAAPIEIAFEALLAELGPESQMPEENGGSKPYPFTLEPWPGGRWFRDLGNKTGHLWGHIQVIKPPTLIEIRGPLFMSYPAINFLQYRLTAEGPTTRLALTHRAMGLIPADHSEGVNKGWEYKMNTIRQIAERRNKARAH